MLKDGNSNSKENKIKETQIKQEKDQRISY